MLLLPELALGRLEALFLICASLLCLGLGELLSVPLFSGLFFGSHSLLHFCLGASGVLLNLPHGLFHVGSSFVKCGFDALLLDVIVEQLPAPQAADDDDRGQDDGVAGVHGSVGAANP
ncbi:hypothetical protein Q023_00905 [Pseudomonas aeruginosa BWHPSA010]|nr:hypothetical protein Q023_00905 [Pseudomonas aeruginosa BWHPSA010]